MPIYSNYKIFILHIFILLISCNDSSNPKEQSSLQWSKQTESYVIQKEIGQEKLDPLLSKYQFIDFDTFHVWYQYNAKIFKGIPLTDMEISKFYSKESRVYDDFDMGVFACYKFSIDQNRIGLITRTPSEYESSSIKLFIYDISSKQISLCAKLAEIFGDAGDAMTRESWIYFNTQKKPYSFIWQKESYDHSVNDRNDTVIEHWNYYYLLDLSKCPADTINSDSTYLTQKFKRIIN